mmetsp:Transcript_18916/g.29040  ORF Transcript_18916/g.29040 Transcript_18916/m.29040 type:complete len:82 (-) Transcript_18916:1170-1415(-)
MDIQTVNKDLENIQKEKYLPSARKQSIHDYTASPSPREEPNNCDFTLKKPRVQQQIIETQISNTPPQNFTSSPSAKIAMTS